MGYKGSRYGSIVTYDGQWRRTGGWLIPEAVQAAMAPHAASGGGIGPDGLFHLLGHDRPELYVLESRLGPVRSTWPRSRLPRKGRPWRGTAPSPDAASMPSAARRG